MVDISIVIPSYNTSRIYLQNCINSILCQTFSKFEVIIIDDGSEPEYARFIEEIASRDKRIRVYHKTNKGVSEARNYGVSLATGRYITFVDADDQVAPLFLERAYHIIQEKQADIIYGLVILSKEPIKTFSDVRDQMVIKADNEMLKKYHIGFYYKDGDLILGRGPYARIIRSEIAKKNRFPVGVPIGEDVLWNLDILHSTNKKYIAHEAWYNYIQREDSVTHKYDIEIESKLMPFYRLLSQKITTDSDYYLFICRLMRDLHGYVYRSFLGHHSNKNCFIMKWHQFNTICKAEPWKQIKEKRVTRYCTIIQRFTRRLFIMKMLYPFWKLTEYIK